MEAAKDPFRYFRLESKELLDGLQQGVLEMESSREAERSKSIVGRLLRIAHTLKGAARVVKKTEISDDAHAIEELLAPFRDGTQIPAPDTVRRLLALIDRIGLVIHALPKAEEKSAGPVLAPPVQANAARAATPAEAFESVRVEVEDLDRILDRLTNSTVDVRALRADLGALEKGARGQDGAARLHRNLSRQLDRMESDLRWVRERAGELRLLPVKNIFPSLRRALRDAAELLNKQVEIATADDDIRMDANVLSAVQGALLHVVRNAAAHGIESAEERVAAGKPAAGQVRLSVERRGAWIAFVCEDDGRGIDYGAVRGAATKAGIVTAAQADALSPEQITELLLKGGITTSRSATQVSGRGVGLDVLRNTAQGLDGAVQVRSQAGRGTKIELTARISLASLAALSVSAGGALLAIPNGNVRGSLRISQAELVSSADGEALLFEGASIPFFWLSSLLFQQEPPRKKKQTLSVLIIEAGGARVAVGVDRILDFETVLARPLPARLGKSAFVSGIYLNAEGDPQLVLDPESLVRAKGVARKSHSLETEKEKTVLVIDDSLTTRMLEQSILESAGYRVSLATSAEEAFEKAKQAVFGLFVVDVEMPGMNGFEFVAKARQHPLLKNIPAILVTSCASPEDLRRGLEAGARAHIMKSEFEQGKFLKIVGELIG